MSTGQTPSRQNRYRGALLGLAAGDAVGTTVEFRRRGSFEPVTDMVGGGHFGLEPGQWTDDTSMAMCVAESLVQRRGFDPADQLRRFVRWYREGYWSSTGECFDIGNSTRRAVEAFERNPHDPYPGRRDPDGAGNGPLMKLAPVPLAFARDPEAALRVAERSALTTHGAPQAQDACRYVTGLLTGALDGVPKDELLAPGGYVPYDGAFDQPLHPAIAAVAEGSFLEKSPPEIDGDGYVVLALEAALWAFATTDSFEAAVLAATNLGNDADTTAAIAGQLAGAVHGVDGIPGRWRERLTRHDDIRDLADGLYALAEAGPAEELP